MSNPIPRFIPQPAQLEQLTDEELQAVGVIRLADVRRANSTALPELKRLINAQPDV